MHVRCEETAVTMETSRMIIPVVWQPLRGTCRIVVVVVVVGGGGLPL